MYLRECDVFTREQARRAGQPSSITLPVLWHYSLLHRCWAEAEREAPLHFLLRVSIPSKSTPSGKLRNAPQIHQAQHHSPGQRTNHHPSRTLPTETNLTQGPEFLSNFIHLLACICWCAQVWRSEDNLEESVFSFHCAHWGSNSGQVAVSVGPGS